MLEPLWSKNHCQAGHTAVPGVLDHYEQGYLLLISCLTEYLCDLLSRQFAPSAQDQNDSATRLD